MGAPVRRGGAVRPAIQRGRPPRRRARSDLEPCRCGRAARSPGRAAPRAPGTAPRCRGPCRCARALRRGAWRGQRSCRRSSCAAFHRIQGRW